MIKVKQAVIVEGKYDKIKLSNIIDALIIETNGFSIYKDREKLNFIRKLARERGIIIITDSDHSGFQIRNYISNGIPKDCIKHIYIPDVIGKESRKDKPSKEGKIGVEGIDDSILIELFNRAGIENEIVERVNPVTNYDLFEYGISGSANAKENKKKLLKALNLPEFLSTKSLLTYINSSMNKEEFENICKSI